MDVNEKINQLVDLMADLVPTVDKLAVLQEKTNSEIRKLTSMQERTNVEMHEMRTSNMKLAEAIDGLVAKIDRLNDLENRVSKIEKIVIK